MSMAVWGWRVRVVVTRSTVNWEDTLKLSTPFSKSFDWICALLWCKEGQLSLSGFSFTTYSWFLSTSLRVALPAPSGGVGRVGMPHWQLR